MRYVILALLCLSLLWVLLGEIDRAMSGLALTALVGIPYAFAVGLIKAWHRSKREK